MKQQSGKHHRGGVERTDSMVERTGSTEEEAPKAGQPEPAETTKAGQPQGTGCTPEVPRAAPGGSGGPFQRQELPELVDEASEESFPASDAPAWILIQAA